MNVIKKSLIYETNSRRENDLASVISQLFLHDDVVRYLNLSAFKISIFNSSMYATI